MKAFLVFVFAGLATVGSAEWVSIGPDGGNVMALAIDPNNSSRLLAIPYTYPDTPNVYVSEDSGANWQVAGRFGGLYPLCLAIDHHQPRRVYALGRSGLFLFSTDGGETWNSRPLSRFAYALKPDPHIEGRVFACGYEVIGGNPVPVVFVSTDYGENWFRVIPDSQAISIQAFSLAFDPNRSDLVWLGCNGARVYRSEDGGTSWELRGSGLPENSTVQMISVNPDNSSIVLAATSAGAYRTTDEGENWYQVEVPQAIMVDFPLTDGARGYAIGYNETTRASAVFVSTDSGATWSLAQPGIVLDKGSGFCSDPNVPLVAYVNNTRGVFRTVDGANNWSERHSGLRFAHISTISVSPVDSGRVYLEFYENGVYKSLDGGNTWQRCEDFLACGNICGIGIAPNAGVDVLYALEGKG
ncbi:MAG: YCF48-related protein [candidate division WOR-3 bacterium]